MTDERSDPGDDERTYRRRPRSVYRVLEGRGLLASVNKQAVAIGGAALFVWFALESPATTQGVLRRIIAEFPELGTISHDDVLVAIEKMVEEGWVEIDTRADDESVDVWATPSEDAAGGDVR